MINLNNTRFWIVIQCCRCDSICGPEEAERLTVSGVAAGGVRGELARSEFLMSRRKIVKGKLSYLTRVSNFQIGNARISEFYES